jgi:hypothetical protein
VNIYLTGDNTRQPKAKLVQGILERYLMTREQLVTLLSEDQAVQNRAQEVDFITLVNLSFSKVASGLKWLQNKIEATGQGILASRISAMAEKN